MMIARPWTDDLPKCRNTCVASYFSQHGGNSNSTDDYLCFYCQTEDNNSCLYGVFEPHNGLDAARFIMQRMAAELLLPPPSINNTDEEIRDRLRNAFVSVEKAYIENYDGMIAERTSLQYRLQTLSETQEEKGSERENIVHGPINMVNDNVLYRIQLSRVSDKQRIDYKCTESRLSQDWLACGILGLFVLSMYLNIRRTS